MSTFSFGSPSDDSRCMQCGLRDMMNDQQFNSQGMVANCAGQGSLLDGSSAKVIWMSSVVTALVIFTVHLTRLFGHGSENVLGETLVFLLAISGAAIFLYDVQRCNIQMGMCKMVILLVFANCIVPRLFNYSRSFDAHVDEDNVEEE